MGKIAFCFPGQGSLEQGMGKEFADAIPEAMEVFERGSEATGLDLKVNLWEHAFTHPSSPIYKDLYERSGDYEVWTNSCRIFWMSGAVDLRQLS